MKKIITLSSLFFIGVLIACSDSFLEVKPKAALSSSSLQNGKGVNALLIGAYSLLDGWATAEGAYRSYQVGADNWVYGSVVTSRVLSDQRSVRILSSQSHGRANVDFYQGKRSEPRRRDTD